MKRALGIPDWLWKSPTADIVFCSTKRIFKSKEKFLYFQSIDFSSVKKSFSSTPKVYGTIFLRIRGTRCLQLQERFSSFQSFLGFSLFSKEVKEGRDDKATPLFFCFFFLEMVYLCICFCVYVFCVLFCHDPSYLLSTKVCSNILS